MKNKTSDYSTPSAAESFSLLRKKVAFSCTTLIQFIAFCFIVHLVLIIICNIIFLHTAYAEIVKYLLFQLSHQSIPNFHLLKEYFIRNILTKNIVIVTLTSPSWILITVLLLWLAKRSGKKTTKTKYIRGAILFNEDQLANEINSSGSQTRIALTLKLKIPRHIETGHFGCTGATGAGKTQTINRFVSALHQSKVRQVIHDIKGDYYATFSTDDDVMFNPLDERHMGMYGGWSLFSSINTTYDIEAVAASLIPDLPQAKDPFWQIAPRQLLGSCLRYCHYTGKTKNSDIWNIVSASLDDLVNELKNIPGAEKGFSHIKEKGKAANDIRSILISYCQSLEYMADTDGDFVIEDWLKNGKGSIYIINYPQIKDALKPVLSLFIDLMIKKTLSLPVDHDRRIAFVIDEAPQLQKLNALVDLLTLARDRGALNIVGYQTNSGLRKIYGHDDTTTILGNLKSKVICNLTDVETAEYYERLLGKAEEIRSTKSHNLGGKETGVGYNEHFEKRPVVTADDIMNLRVTEKSYQAVVKLAGYSPALIEFPIIHYPQKNETFKPKPGVHLDHIKEKSKAAISEEAIITRDTTDHNAEEEMDYHNFE